MYLKPPIFVLNRPTATTAISPPITYYFEKKTHPYMCVVRMYMYDLLNNLLLVY